MKNLKPDPSFPSDHPARLTADAGNDPAVLAPDNAELAAELAEEEAELAAEEAAGNVEA